jgi:TonB family protein
MGQDTFHLLSGEILGSKDDSALKHKGFIFLFSIFLHAVLFVFLLNIQLFFPVEIPEWEVYEVKIQEPESLYFPEGEIEFPEPYEYFRRALRENFDPVQGSIDPTESTESLRIGDPEEQPAGSLPYKSDPLLFSDTLSRFRLDQPEDKEAGLSFNIDRAPELEKRNPGSPPRELKIPDVQYSRSTGPLPSGFSWSNRRGEEGRILEGRRTSNAIADIDISSWADETIRKIQENWSIPSESSENIKGSVGVYLKVRKKGDLISADIVESSGFTSLDQAAMKALDASFPLPELPESFPAESLEIYLVFEYDV